MLLRFATIAFPETPIVPEEAMELDPLVLRLEPATETEPITETKSCWRKELSVPSILDRETERTVSPPIEIEPEPEEIHPPEPEQEFAPAETETVPETLTEETPAV